MCEELSYQIINTSAANQVALLEYCRNHYRKENINVDGIKQDRDTLFWINLKQIWLNVFILL